ncbi:hypothetical protein EDD76_109168 [Kineothrix alysoides]|uniref:Cof subfamily protein (Haloacid dehalogenase superfamily)/HAD superfamily hydrolase (TIGR01484 family) n=1 Tax=Kineothrix alysoides TaxID=1469948 RepID=A0A4R1QWQ4_9FIRM|nr:Cof-type HAD-IIB family hydrolase [Kineothrix alysoides]TCL57305.1 hypothetical protein EDD76_109168 [Kineothrix alysoides]
MIKLICIDMDGTLLGDEFSIPGQNLEVLKHAVEAGVEIALVSGRPFNIARYFADLIHPKVHVIATNGTYFRYNQAVYEKSLNAEQMERIYTVAAKHHLVIHFKGRNKVISNEWIEESHPYKRTNPKLKEEDKMEFIENADLNKVLEGQSNDIYKALIFRADKVLEENLIQAKLELKQYEDLEVVSSHPCNFEVMRGGTSKGEAVRELSAYLGIKRDEIMCIGDNENDISMIRYGALGIAMGNGTEEIKAAADYITDTNINAGVAKAVQKFVLQKDVMEME